MWHSVERAEISEEKCMYICMYVPAWPLPGKGVHDSYSRKLTMRNFLYLDNGFVTTNIATATIDRGGYKRKARDSFKRVHDESPRYTRATPK
jgi:hypothetical protein